MVGVSEGILDSILYAASSENIALFYSAFPSNYPNIIYLFKL